MIIMHVQIEISILHNIIILFQNCAHQLGWRSEPLLPAVLNIIRSHQMKEVRNREEFVDREYEQ
jgi:hypothetical protein